MFPLTSIFCTYGNELSSTIILINASLKLRIIGEIDALVGAGYALVPKNYLKSIYFFNRSKLDELIIPLVKFHHKITYILILNSSYEELYPHINDMSVSNFHLSMYLFG